MVKTFCRCFFEKGNIRKSQYLQGFRRFRSRLNSEPVTSPLASHSRLASLDTLAPSAPCLGSTVRQKRYSIVFASLTQTSHATILPEAKFLRTHTLLFGILGCRGCGTLKRFFGTISAELLPRSYSPGVIPRPHRRWLRDPRCHPRR